MIGVGVLPGNVAGFSYYILLFDVYWCFGSREDEKLSWWDIVPS
jgi:hypothetical protein